MTRFLTPYLWLAGLYVAFGISVARGDVWSTAKPPKLEANPVVKPSLTTAKPQFTYRTVAGHYHKCPRCSHEWGHSSGTGSVSMHTCPKCRYGPVWNIHRYGPVSVPVKPRVAAAPCPTGH